MEGASVEIENAPVPAAQPNSAADKHPPFIVKDITAANQGGFLDNVTARMKGMAQNRFVRLLVANPVARYLSYGSRYDVSLLVCKPHTCAS